LILTQDLLAGWHHQGDRDGKGVNVENRRKPLP
jgi:hypothetical protein